MPKPYILQREIWLPQSRPEVFDFFRDAANLQRITPSFLDFQIKTPLPITMLKGTIIDYELKLNGLPFGWRTEITEWKPCDYFIDSQIRGPYKMWVHLHRFEDRDGGTWMQDRVEYQVPGGPAAPLIHAVLVRRKVEAIFGYRQKAIHQIFFDEIQTVATHQR